MPATPTSALPANHRHSSRATTVTTWMLVETSRARGICGYRGLSPPGVAITSSSCSSSLRLAVFFLSGIRITQTPSTDQSALGGVIPIKSYQNNVVAGAAGSGGTSGRGRGAGGGRAGRAVRVAAVGGGCGLLQDAARLQPRARAQADGHGAGAAGQFQERQPQEGGGARHPDGGHGLEHSGSTAGGDFAA
ncbi:hypothetical protein ON010_g1988 [Phytophthora cinnamomi]|nr:hypothetical protein ON010_g1988 [Phytophthora cinnamomi]